MDFATAWRDLYTLRYVPITFIQAVSAAGTIFVVSAVQAVSGIRLASVALQRAREKTKQAIHYLQEVSESFANAGDIADILDNLLEQQVDLRVSRKHHFVNSIYTGSAAAEIIAPRSSSNSPETHSSISTLPLNTAELPPPPESYNPFSFLPPQHNEQELMVFNPSATAIGDSHTDNLSSLLMFNPNDFIPNAVIDPWYNWGTAPPLDASMLEEQIHLQMGGSFEQMFLLSSAE